MSLRKKIVLAVAAVLVMSMGAYGTLAYLTADITTHNVITSGKVAIELLDKTVQKGEAADSFDAVYKLADFNDPDLFAASYDEDGKFVSGGMSVMPGSEASKVVAVRKVPDSAPCWVRVRLNERLTDKDSGSDVWDSVFKDGDISLVLNEGSGPDQWTRSVDQYGVRWWYYNSKLTDDNFQTVPLLTQVLFSGPGIDNSYVGKVYSIDVTAQAVQSDNNEDGPVQASGWPVLAPEA